MDSPKLRKYIFKYLGEKVDYRRAEWRDITPEQREAKLNDLRRQADRSKALIEPVEKVEKKKRRLEGQKIADRKYREQNLEKRRQQLREASKRLRDKRKREKEERRKAAAQKILGFIQDSKVKKYTVNILVTWLITKKKGKKYEFREHYHTTFTTTERKLDIDVFEILKAERRRMLGVSGDIIDVKIVTYKYTYVKIEDKTADDLAKVRMRDIGKCDLDGYEQMFKWHKNIGTCVFDYLIYRYGKIDRLKTRCGSYDNINLLLNGIDPNHLKEDIEDIVITDFKDIGVNCYDLKRFCMVINIPMYAVDDDNKTFYQYSPSKHDRKFPSLIFRCSNNHFYPLTKPEGIQSVIQTYKLQVSSEEFQYYQKEDKKDLDFEKDSLDTAIFENTNGLEELKKVLTTTKYIPSKIIMNKREIKAFQIKDLNKNYVINHQVENCRKICKNMNVKYTGQGIGSVLAYIINDTLKRPMPKSSPNPAVNDIFKLAKKNRCHMGKLSNDYDKLINDPKTKSYDIKKCYTSLLYNAKEDWPIITFNDNWEPFDGEIKYGFYEVATDDLLLFKGCGIYFYNKLLRAQDKDITFYIKQQLIPSQKIPKETFKPIIDNIIKYCDGVYTDEEKQTPMYKYVNNMFSGQLAKSKNYSTKVGINSCVDMILYEIHKNQHLADDIIMQKIPDTEYFLYGTIKQIQLPENNIPMYIALLDSADILLDELHETVGGKLLCRKTDCITVYDPKPKFNGPLKYGNEWGNFVRSEHPKLNYDEKPQGQTYNHVKPWKDYKYNDSKYFKEIMDIGCKYGGVLVRGGPGNGKTYVANNIASILKRNIRLAPTNKAALLIKGKTVHKFLALNEENEMKISHKLVEFIRKNYTYIFVDEISMNSAELWNKLCLLKQAVPHLIFFLFGDEDQLPPVEDEKIKDYFNHPAVKYLVNNNRVTLSKVYRFSPEMREILDNIKDNKETDLSALAVGHIPNTQVNLCFFNHTRIYINEYWNKKLKPEGCLFLPENPNNDYSQDVYIYHELPVIACKTINNKKDGDICCNNEQFKVTYYDEENIYLQSVRYDDENNEVSHDVEIPIKRFQELFLLNYCSTTHKSQGDTIKEPITLYDWDSPILEKLDKDYIRKLRYTAISRVQLAELAPGEYEPLKSKLNISSINAPYRPDTFLRQIKRKINNHLTEDKLKHRDIKNYVDVEYIRDLYTKQAGLCERCECEMLTANYPKNCGRQFTIDRIDSNLGHVKGNVKILCWACNCSKKKQR